MQNKRRLLTVVSTIFIDQLHGFQAEIRRQRWCVVSKDRDHERRPPVLGGELTRTLRGDGHQESRPIRQRVRQRVHRGNNDRLLETWSQQVDPVERHRRQTGKWTRVFDYVL